MGCKMKKGGGMRVQSQAIIVLRLIDGYYFQKNSEKSFSTQLRNSKKVGMEETPPSLSPPKHLICLLDMENKCCIG